MEINREKQNEVADFLKLLYSEKMTTTSGGNISLKWQGDLYITPSGLDKGVLRAENVAVVGRNGEIFGNPSCEVPFHQKCYETEGVGGVIHGHPLSMVSLSLLRKRFENDFFGYEDLKVSFVDYFLPGSIELGVKIAEEIKKGFNTVVMFSHGVVTCGKDLTEAFQRFEKAERLGELVLALGGNVEKPQIPLALEVFGEKEKREDNEEFFERGRKRGVFSRSSGYIFEKEKNGFFATNFHGTRKIETPKSTLEELVARLMNEKDINFVTLSDCPALVACSILKCFQTRTIPESYMVLGDVETVDICSPMQYVDLKSNTQYVDLKSNTQYIDVKNSEENVGLENFAEIIDLAKSGKMGVLVSGGFFLSFGSTLLKAYDRMEVASFTAQTILECQSLGKAFRISQAKVEEIVNAFPPKR